MAKGQNDLKKLIEAAEKEVKDSKKERKESIKRIMEGKDFSSPPKKKIAISDKGWEDWNISKMEEDTSEAKKARMLTNIFYALAILIVLGAFAYFHITFTKIQEEHSGKANLPLNKMNSSAVIEKKGARRSSVKSVDNTSTPAFYGSSNSVSSLPPDVPPNTIKSIKEYRRKMQKKRPKYIPGWVKEAESMKKGTASGGPPSLEGKEGSVAIKNGSTEKIKTSNIASGEKKDKGRRKEGSNAEISSGGGSEAIGEGSGGEIGREDSGGTFVDDEEVLMQ